MKEITINDVRRAISYVGFDARKWSDEKLLGADFIRDLDMGNIRVANVSIEIQRIHNISLPPEMFQQMKENTVGAFLKAANDCLKCQSVVC
ncbi:MAG: hypothetical protein IJ218_04075 [Alphaproteobacteria bacterium]|nr:hypothetical protein [Alphaproteobacteria bacterium]